jgi:adenylate cyclase
MFLNPPKAPLAWFKLRFKSRRNFFKQRPRPGEQPANRFGLWSGLMVAAISVSFSASGAWELLEQQSYNQLHQAKRALVGTPTWDERVVVVAIDEASVARLGRFPWTRDRYADLLNQLQSAQPAVVTFDILFPEPTEQDARLSQAIVESANVVLAVGTDSYDSYDSYLNVSPSITQGADGFFLRGDIGNAADIDGVSRQLPIDGPGLMPSLGLATLQVYTETLASTAQATAQSIVPSENFPQSPDPNFLSSGSLKDQRLWLNWPGETTEASAIPLAGDLQTYSYIDVIDGRVDASLFQNKIVLVGTTLAGLDPLRSPFQTDPPTSGVYLYAAALNNLLNQSYLRRPPLWQGLLLLVALAFASSYLLRRQGVYRRLAIVIGFPLLWCGLALGLFWLGWWIPVAAPIGTLLLSALAIQLYEQQEKQQLMALFSMNVSPGTAELIWRHKGVILHQGELAAQKLTATVLFMDIRGFTSIAETLPSQQLLPWLNQYFETMTDCIMKHGGMVDKYIGDEIMAVFGAPLPRTQPEEIQADAIAALHAALEMHERLRALNQHLAAQKLPLIKFGIGIHTGPLIGGTVGNRHRLNYSLFGDTVNIAARLESMTKALPEEAPFKLLLSADTCQYTQDYFPVQLFRSGQLRGREGHTDVYTVAAQAVAVQAVEVQAVEVQAVTVQSIKVQALPNAALAPCKSPKAEQPEHCRH